PWVQEGDPAEEWWFLRKFIVRRSYLLRAAESAYRRLVPRAGLAAPDPGGIATFAAYYRALVQQIRANGATPVAMTFAIAYPGTFDDVDREKIRQSFGTWVTNGYIRPEVGRQVIDAENQALVDLAHEKGVPVSDIASAVPADREHFIDFCHLRAAGNRLIAETLARTLDPLLKAHGAVRTGTIHSGGGRDPHGPRSLRHAPRGDQDGARPAGAGGPAGAPARGVRHGPAPGDARPGPRVLRYPARLPARRHAQSPDAQRGSRAHPRTPAA